MEATRLSEASSPRLHEPADDELPRDFVPLRLLLQPGGLCVELHKPSMMLGRHSEADVRLALPDVSRRHCRFVFGDGAWQVVDLHSLNGIWVNEVRLDEATLSAGDRLRVGSLTFAVEYATHPIADEEHQAGVIKSIAEVLPTPGEEKRKAS